MRLFSVLFLWISGITFAQSLSLEIESITAKDSIPEQREFKMKYFLKNNSTDTIHFFFDPNEIHPSTSGSLSQSPYYKIYENNAFIEVGQIFQSQSKSTHSFPSEEYSNLTEKEFYQKYIEYVSERYQKSLDTVEAIFKEKGVSGVYDYEIKNYYADLKMNKGKFKTLLPNEKLEFSMHFYWNKNRYFYTEPNEFYLDENAKHYFEITLVALKEEFKDKIDIEIYEKIMKMPNFIKGVFVSNKVEINLQN